MKKTLLTIAAIAFMGITANAQKGFYVSLAGGPSYKAGQKLLTTSDGASYGSYGEGIQAQLRGGYFFNDKFGVELGVGYLHGEEQVVKKSATLTAYGKARAYGAALTGIYNISENVYVKAGLLTKIAGKSINSGVLKVDDLPAQVVNSDLPASLTLPLVVNFEREGKAKLPLGYIAALGVKHRFKNSNFGIFAEMEYQGINVTPDRSTLTSYSANVTTPQGVVPLTREFLLAKADLLVLAGKIKAEDKLSIVDEFTYASEADSSKNVRKEFDIPYSSFGFMFGINYFFD